MRASQWLLGLATTSAIFGAVAAGCGGSSSSGGGTTKDSGPDVSAAETSLPEAAKEAAAETGGPQDAQAEACVPVDADLTQLQVPDSGLPDAGIDIAACVSCLKTSCNSELQACNADCVCIDTIVGCLSGGSLSVSCVGAAALTNAAIQGLGICAQSACATPCTPAKPPTDGGGEGGGEAGTDAAGD
ncbi:MAG: hypothetical protein ACRELB_01035 [Polyangiaceae bacterium]